MTKAIIAWVDGTVKKLVLAKCFYLKKNGSINVVIAYKEFTEILAVKIHVLCYNNSCAKKT